jgi:hypothetical protein
MEQMPLIPESPDVRLTRDQTAAALTESGFPTAAKTLATLASRGGGPPFEKYGPRAIYTWGHALEWARGRLTEPRRSTSENDVSPAAARPQPPRSLMNAGDIAVHDGDGHRRMSGKREA